MEIADKLADCQQIENEVNDEIEEECIVECPEQPVQPTEGHGILTKQVLRNYYPAAEPPGFRLLPLASGELAAHCEARRLSLVENEEMAEKWGRFVAGRTLPALPRARDFHFHNNMVRYQPLQTQACGMRMKAGPLLTSESQLPVPADCHRTYRAYSGYCPHKFEPKPCPPKEKCLKHP